ncbi:hypothetical protein H109_04676 [Trichophyton interdigitale MR816]|uniref:Uncharacterized protein n=1 Tax=Trichophyton interdigitale (strain MR816) TaxID=1215338 RepID=A0A059J7G9_TRIIM|nr:hypothetical protein H101_00368 [Trichophyton interdigitale H6]KDB23442.1 hypothetical protein H109_04676 [Trichophyton interdigitale MR816]
MAHSNSLLYIDQEPLLQVLPAEPAIEPCFPLQLTYLPTIEQSLYIVREQPPEQVIQYQGVIPIHTGQCPICQALHDRSYTYQYLLPVEIHVRNEFIPVYCGKHIQLMTDEGIALSYPPVHNNITFVQSTVNYPNHVMLNSNEASHQSRPFTPKVRQSGHRRRTRTHHLPKELHKRESDGEESRSCKVPDSAVKTRHKPARSPSPIPFSRAPTLAETPAIVHTDKANVIPPQACSDSTKRSPEEASRPYDIYEKRTPVQQGGYKSARAESIFSCSTDSTKLGIIPPHKLAVPRNPHTPPENRPRVTGRSYDTTKKGGKMGWLRFWRS